MNRRTLRGSLLLLLGAAIWGSAFVAQDVAMNFIGPYAFNALRYLIGALTLLPVIIVEYALRRRREPEKPPAERRAYARLTVKAGLLAGLALIVPTTLQQIGLTTTDAGKAGMITGMYIVTVPLLGLFLGKKAGINVWLAVGLGVVGMYLLCVTESLTVAPGDALLLISIVFWAVQILTIDRYADRVNCFAMVALEFLVCSVVSAVLTVFFEQPTLEGVRGCILPLLYAGVLSCGVAYMLQPLGQRDTPPAAASLIMCLESVFAALTGYLVLGDGFTGRELVGCVLMLTAAAMAQLPFGKKAKAVPPESPDKP